MAMLTKQQTLTECRRRLWASAGKGEWAPLKLEGFTPGIVEDDGTHRPRGSGEELDRLRPSLEPRTVASSTNPLARDYWQRLWENLPGRHQTEDSRSFQTARLWNFLRRSASAEHKRDSSPWHFQHLDAWKVARSGPLREIFQAFQENLEFESFAPHVEPTRDDIMNRWWHGEPEYEDQ